MGCLCQACVLHWACYPILNATTLCSEHTGQSSLFQQFVGKAGLSHSLPAYIVHYYAWAGYINGVYHALVIFELSMNANRIMNRIQNRWIGTLWLMKPVYCNHNTISVQFEGVGTWQSYRIWITWSIHVHTSPTDFRWGGGCTAYMSTIWRTTISQSTGYTTSSCTFRHWGIHYLWMTNGKMTYIEGEVYFSNGNWRWYLMFPPCSMYGNF